MLWVFLSLTSDEWSGCCWLFFLCAGLVWEKSNMLLLKLVTQDLGESGMIWGQLLAAVAWNSPAPWRYKLLAWGASCFTSSTTSTLDEEYGFMIWRWWSSQLSNFLGWWKWPIGVLLKPSSSLGSPLLKYK